MHPPTHTHIRQPFLLGEAVSWHVKGHEGCRASGRRRLKRGRRPGDKGLFWPRVVPFTAQQIKLQVGCGPLKWEPTGQYFAVCVCVICLGGVGGFVLCILISTPVIISFSRWRADPLNPSSPCAFHRCHGAYKT